MFKKQEYFYLIEIVTNVISGMALYIENLIYHFV